MTPDEVKTLYGLKVVDHSFRWYAFKHLAEIHQSNKGEIADKRFKNLDSFLKKFEGISVTNPILQTPGTVYESYKALVDDSLNYYPGADASKEVPSFILDKYIGKKVWEILTMKEPFDNASHATYLVKLGDTVMDMLLGEKGEGIVQFKERFDIVSKSFENVTLTEGQRFAIQDHKQKAQTLDNVLTQGIDKTVTQAFDEIYAIRSGIEGQNRRTERV